MPKILGYDWEDIKAMQQREGSLSAPVDTSKPGDYGFDPVGDGKVKLVPSGEIVELAEALQKLGRKY